MKTVADPFASNNVPMEYADRELTTRDVVECAQHLEATAVILLMARKKIVETTIRDWLIDNRRGTSTTRQEFEEAVHNYVNGRVGSVTQLGS